MAALTRDVVAERIAGFPSVAADRPELKQAAVALCVDLSWSMYAEGRWASMKQTALALAHLIATRYPQDALQVIGFGRTAAEMTSAELAAVEPGHVQGTNLQHALALARRHVARHPTSQPVVLVVTDGEPTAHLEPDGDAFFDWPTTPTTLRLTLTEQDPAGRIPGRITSTFPRFELQLLNEKFEVVARLDSPKGKYSFDNLAPGSYRLRALLDVDGDGRQDGGGHEDGEEAG